MVIATTVILVAAAATARLLHGRRRRLRDRLEARDKRRSEIFRSDRQELASETMRRQFRKA